MLTTVKAQACQGTQKDRPGPGVEPQAWGKRARTPEPVEKEVSEDITSLPDYECLSQKKRCKRDHPQSAQAPNLALVIKHVKQAFKTEIYEIQRDMLFRCASISSFQVVTE